MYCLHKINIITCTLSICYKYLILIYFRNCVDPSLEDDRHFHMPTLKTDIDIQCAKIQSWIKNDMKLDEKHDIYR